jgi:hypothetical protein
VRQLVGQLALARQRGVVAPGQGVDGFHHRAEFLLGVGVAQGLTLADVQRVHVARQVVQRPQALADGQPQHQRDDRQQPQAGLRNLRGNVLGQVVALALAQQHHDLALVAFAVPAREGAPRHGRVAQVQRLEPLGRRERRRRCVAGARDQVARGVPHHHAHGLLVVVALERARAGQRGGIATPGKAAFALGQQQAGHAGQVAVGEFVGLVAACHVAHHHKAHPHRQQRPQRPGQQVPGERTAGRHGRSPGRFSGTK